MIENIYRNFSFHINIFIAIECHFQNKNNSEYLQTEEEKENNQTENQKMSLEQKNESTASEIEQNKTLNLSAFISTYEETNNITMAQKKILDSLPEIKV